MNEQQLISKMAGLSDYDWDIVLDEIPPAAKAQVIREISGSLDRLRARFLARQIQTLAPEGTHLKTFADELVEIAERSMTTTHSVAIAESE